MYLQKIFIMAMQMFIMKESILEKIYVIRGLKVMLDRDLAEMYGVEVRVLNQAVKRNANRFPGRFYVSTGTK